MYAPIQKRFVCHTIVDKNILYAHPYFLYPHTVILYVSSFIYVWCHPYLLYPIQVFGTLVLYDILLNSMVHLELMYGTMQNNCMATHF